MFVQCCKVRGEAFAAWEEEEGMTRIGKGGACCIPAGDEGKGKHQTTQVDTVAQYTCVCSN